MGWYSRNGFMRTLTVLVFAVCVAASSASQEAHGLVVDQTGLPLPGVTLQFLDGVTLVREITSSADGTFPLGQTLGLTILASLDGFEPTRVPIADASRIVLPVARTTESTTVTASPETAGSPTALTGSTLTSRSVARLPSSHMHAKESLPLLPSVIRGADGLMQLGGARAYQTPLTLDGFTVTDPGTGLSSLNLPLESLLSVDALRDPMATTYGDLLGGMVRMDSRAGGEMPTFGVQGFVPRPRFASHGFGRIEGIFPRAHVAGTAREGRVQYSLSGEYDYERIPVPHVTNATGADLIEESAIFFARVDTHLTPRSSLTVEAFHFPADTRFFGLSPRRASEASVTLASHDTFGGVVGRHIFERGHVLTLRVGVFSRTSASRPNGTDWSVLTPAGWTHNWFSEWTRDSHRVAGSLSWDRTVTHHELSASVRLAAVGLSGRVTEREARVYSASGALLRAVTFAGPAALSAVEKRVGFALRDVWHVHPRIQVDAGLRLDDSTLTPSVPSVRAGVRYNLDGAGRTVLKAGLGRFVGVLPLVAATVGQYPVRTDTWFDESTGQSVRRLVMTPSTGRFERPRARTLVVGAEREVSPGFDVQVVATVRHSVNLPMLDVPDASGPLRAGSGGTSSYKELQLSGRRLLPHDQQVFVSYVRSAAVGELNEITEQTMDTPLLEPGGPARNRNDAPHRVLAWATVNLPARVVVSPAAEWHSGFTYSLRSPRYTYLGTPNSQRFPSFFSLDLVTYKTVTLRGFDVDLGAQVFNLTDHWNPRDVFPVVGEPDFGRFDNSVGTIIRGYMLLKW